MRDSKSVISSSTNGWMGSNSILFLKLFDDWSVLMIFYQKLIVFNLYAKEIKIVATDKVKRRPIKQINEM